MTKKKHQFSIACLLAACALLNACAMFKHEKTSTRALEGLPQYWLTTSMYAAPREAKSTLLSPSFIEATRIVPAGTLVQITGLSTDNRQFLVHLRVARERGRVSIFSEWDHVLKAPSHISTKRELKRYLANFLSKKDPHPWLLTARNYIQEGIWHKQPTIGMSKRELFTSMGPAIKRQGKKNSDTGRLREIWHYADYFVVIDDQHVTKVKKLSDRGLAQK